MKAYKRTYLIAISMMILLTSMNSCGFDLNTIKGNGVMTTSDFSLDEFTAIDAAGMYRIILQKGTTPFVQVETDENIMPYVNVKVERGTLKIYMDRGNTYRPGRMEVYITMQNPERISLSGATSFSSDDIITTDRLELDLSGATDLKLSVDVGSLHTTVSGAGSIELQGNAQSHHVQLSGAASLKCGDLITRETAVNISGAGSAEVYATEKLNAGIAGVGSIRYGGDPASINMSKSGLGSIKPL